MTERDVMVTVRMSPSEREVLRGLEAAEGGISASDVIRRLLRDEHERRSVAGRIAEIREAWRPVHVAHGMVLGELSEGRPPTAKALKTLRGALEQLWELATRDMIRPVRAHWQGYRNQLVAAERRRDHRNAAVPLAQASETLSAAVDEWIAHVERGDI